MSLPPLPAREARFGSDDLESFLSLAQQQHRQKIDIVGPLNGTRYKDGNLILAGAEPVMDGNGVTDANGLYRPTRTADHQIGGYFGIPTRYMDHMRADHNGSPPLLDTNVNEWAGQAEDKNVLYRMIYGEDPNHPGTSGILRAVKSDRYGVRDNWDTTLACMDGMREAGLDGGNFRGADITDDRLWLRIHAPEVFINAPDLLRGYRDPRTGKSSREVGDVIHAGLVITNSETGLGSLRITPELTILVCTNGLVANKYAMAKVHLGARMDEGQIKWSQRTMDAANELTKLQVKDAITAFLTTDFLSKVVGEWTEKSNTEIEDAQKTLTVVAKRLSYSESEQAGILAHFIKGGQMTAGGVMNAVTSFAQGVRDVTRANDLAATGVEAMELAAVL